MLDTVSPSELLAERSHSVEEIWAAAEARLDRPIAEGLNSAHEACDRWARDRARIAIVVRHPDGRSERWTFADLADASSRLAAALQSVGLRRGDRFAAVLGQQIEAYICALAAWRAGLIYMPLFTGFGAQALTQRLNAATAAAVVVDHRYRDTLAEADLDSDPLIFTVTGNAGRGLRHGDRGLWAEIDRHPPTGGMAKTAASDPATLIFTSGTTGPPKGCVQPHSLPLNLQPFLRHTFALGPSDLLFAGANPGWSYGLYTTGFGVMALGHPRIIYTGDFEPATWLRILAEERVTYTAAAPSAYRKLVPAARRTGNLPQLRGATSAGEPLDGPLVESWRSLTGTDLQDAYGQSESAMLLANLAFDPRPVVPGALGSAVPGFEVALVDDNGVPQEEQGVIAVRKPRYQASTGYWNAQDKWDARWRDDWFLTGDLARRDDDGRYWFIGRDDDLIITSGYNVGPTEVENIVLAHPGVAEAAVVAAPDPTKGSTVRAVIVPNGHTPHERLADEIRQAVREKLGNHAYPRIVDFVDGLPRTETGKIRRNLLRQQ